LWPYTPSHEVKDLHNPYYRGCWHEFNLCLHIITFIIFIINRVLQYNIPSSLSETSWIVPVYIVQDSLLQSIKLRHFLKPIVAVRSSKPARHFRLEKLLKYSTTTNTIKAHTVYYAFSFLLMLLNNKVIKIWSYISHYFLSLRTWNKFTCTYSKHLIIFPINIYWDFSNSNLGSFIILTFMPLNFKKI